MKGIRSILVLLSAATLAAALPAGPAGAALKLPRVSPNATLMQTIGITDVTLTYSRPGVKGRGIWGGLVPYNTPWRTGANEATTINFPDDVSINGQPLPAGKYSFFTIPGTSGWTAVFNKAQNLWGAYAYDSTQDALRVRVQPEPAEFTEWMGFEFDSLTARSARLSVRWEKLRVPITIAVNTDDQVLAEARKLVPEAKPEDWTTPYQAARYVYDNKLANTDEMNQWLAKSIQAKETFQNQGLKARLLAQAGKKDEAVALAERAVKAEKARTLAKGEERVDTSPLEKLITEWKGK
ncbi:MAG TPA: DUF2911 domain-containing protein [Candidatus Saccharimonadales bacterium]|nr:DUF2911 domain-containing protein [Candidatus Saccharimonadales bacterium]